jgi:pimeloyl-ACP methyl ester carboxylesterase
MTEFLDVPGGRIAYDVDGSGPLMVLSHGIGDRRQAYRFLAPMLAQAGYRVANADLRGHGESSLGWASITRTDVAGDLAALIGHLGGPAVIVGHSLSGGAATIAAATRPEQVSGVVEINPFTRKSKPDLGGLLRVRRLPPVRLPADRHAGVPQPGPVAALPRPGLPGQARRLRRLRGRAGRRAA